MAVRRDQQIPGLQGDIQRVGKKESTAHHLAVVAAIGCAIGPTCICTTARAATVATAAAHAATAAHTTAVTVATTTTHAATATARRWRCVWILAMGYIDDPMAIE
jgi:hypothetical protein